MGNQLTPSADKISGDEFATYVAQYDGCIEAISASRACKLMLSKRTTLDKRLRHHVSKTRR